MKTIRFLADNFVTGPEMITVSSARAGAVSGTLARAYGSGLCWSQGAYTGDQALEVFTVSIDSIAAGADPGQATFSWMGGAGTDLEGVGAATSVVPVELRDGVSVKFGGSGFQVGDRWLIDAARPHGKAALLTRSPEQDWQATGCAAETITIDLGAARAPGAFVFGYHNLTASATAVLMADAVQDWGDPDYSLALDTGQRHLQAWPDHSSRYWRLALSDAANPDGVIKAGKIYLGGYLEPSRNLSWGGVVGPEASRQDLQVGGGMVGSKVGAVGRVWSISFSLLTAEDRAALEEMYLGLIRDNGDLDPFWLAPDADDPSETLYGFIGNKLKHTRQQSALARYSNALAFREYGS